MKMHNIRVGRIFAGMSFSRRLESWTEKSGRRRNDHVISLCRIYDRDERMYFWRLIVGPLSLGVALTPKEWTNDRPASTTR